MRRSRGAHAALVAVLISSARDARAYRPFDGTDADVAEVGVFELELGPVHYYRLARNDYLFAPATVLNLGFAPGFEVVCDIKNVLALRPVPGEARERVLDDDLLVKWVLRRGVLQGERGISLALETGPLLPEVHGDRGFGAHANLIGSYRWSAIALHLNEQAGLSRLGNPTVYSGAIVEGPHALPVRPVAEAFVQREFSQGSVYSALIGLIWERSEQLSFDAAGRVAREQGERALELRLGLTWSPTIWGSRER